MGLVVPAVLDVFVTISITILTILLPVYVIAFSLVGPSAGRRKEELDKINAEEAQANTTALEDAKKAIDKKDATEATKKLNDLENQKYQIEVRRKQAERKYSALHMTNAFVFPSTLLAVASALFKSASVTYPVVLDVLNAQFIIPVLLAIGCVAASFKLIWNTLLLIEELGRTVPEFNRQELSSVISEVLKARDKEKPKTESVIIKLDWKDPKPPFKFGRNTSIKIDYELDLHGANTANDAKLLFLLPPGFVFVGHSSWSQGADRGAIANYVSAWKEHGKLQRRISAAGRITINTPDSAGTYKCYYRIISDEYVLDERQEFEITVE
jgi:hypothetical protein